jgi:RpiR family transcriptional regulator, carbohydrate utilization regulator
MMNGFGVNRLVKFVSSPSEKPFSPAPGEMQSMRAVIRKAFRAKSRALSHAARSLEIPVVEHAVAALSRARRVYCYAVEGAGFVAQEAEYQFVRLGINCVAIQDPVQMAIQASMLTFRDVVFASSHSGNNHRILEGLTLAQKAGATTIGLTSRSDSPLAAASDIPLILFVKGADKPVGSADASVTELALIEALASCLALLRHTLGNDPNPVDRNVEAMLSGSGLTP